MITVVVADDQELVRLGLRLVLDAHDDVRVIGEAGDGHEAVRVVTQLRPDVVLMDIRMPGVDGIGAVRQLTQTLEPAPRVVMLATFDLDEYLFGALRAGAVGFLLKDASREQLLEAIRVVHAGDAHWRPPSRVVSSRTTPGVPDQSHRRKRY